jgi:KUP system potassium uptake protein
MVVDGAFFAANLQKIGEGGYVPLVLAAVVYGLMQIWHKGVLALRREFNKSVKPIAAFMAQIAESKIPRVPGTAVFLTRSTRDAPPVMVWHVQHNRVLHERVIIVTVVIELVPWIGPDMRVRVEQIAPNCWRTTAHFGFMQRPDIPEVLQQAALVGCDLDLDDVIYYVGHDTVVPSDEPGHLPRWIEAIFALMQRNALRIADLYKLPRDQVVEIGREVAI